MHTMDGYLLCNYLWGVLFSIVNVIFKTFVLQIRV